MNPAPNFRPHIPLIFSNQKEHERVKQENKHLERILLVDDEEEILDSCRRCLTTSGYQDLLTVSDSRTVMDLLSREEVSVIVLDLRMPNLSGLDLLPQIISQFPQIPVIVATANNEVDTVVNCIKEGAFDYLVKPIEVKRLITAVRKALQMRSISSELSTLKQYLFTDRLDHPETFSTIVTGNKNMRAIFQYLEVVAGTRQPIMITGETGTGKELIARAVHELSGCSGEYVALNAAGLDDNMFSDTLFGHRKGAFTGAEETRSGMVEQAAEGTLFLDEIGDLSLSCQVKLLRLLQEGEYYPLGSDLPKQLRARIVVATHQDLSEKRSSGGFRKDLFYRLRAHHVHIPPLRERKDDIGLLLDHFLEEAALSFGKKVPAYPKELVTLLSTYSFPGNLRELRSMVFDAMSVHSSRMLSMNTFLLSMQDQGERPAAADVADRHNVFLACEEIPTLGEAVEQLVGEAMRRSDNNQTIASRLLGISQPALSKRLKLQRRA